VYQTGENRANGGFYTFTFIKVMMVDRNAEVDGVIR
jgi:hypothetical protein